MAAVDDRYVEETRMKKVGRNFLSILIMLSKFLMDVSS